MNTKCGPLIPNFKNSPAGQASHGWEDDPTEGHLNYWVVCRILVLNYQHGFALLIRPPDHSQQTEILGRGTHALQATSGSFFEANRCPWCQLVLHRVAEACISPLSVGFKEQSDRNTG